MVKRSAISWFDDQSGNGSAAIPWSHLIEAFLIGNWPRITAANPGVIDKLDYADFPETSAQRFRTGVQLLPGKSAGVLEWALSEER